MNRHEMKQLLRSVEKQGFSVKHTRNGHYKISRDGHMVTAPGSPSDYRAIKNLMSYLRKAGYQ